MCVCVYVCVCVCVCVCVRARVCRSMKSFPSLYYCILVNLYLVFFFFISPRRFSTPFLLYRCLSLLQIFFLFLLSSFLSSLPTSIFLPSFLSCLLASFLSSFFPSFLPCRSPFPFLLPSFLPFCLFTSFLNQPYTVLLPPSHLLVSQVCL